MKNTLTLSFAIALSLLSGCGSNKVEHAVKVFPVTGQVTWQGEPVADADVTFFNPDTNRSAFGRTNSEGRYQLTTFEANDGAVAGQQIVTVVKLEAPVETAPAADIESADYVPPETTRPKRGKKVEKPKALIPEKFGSQSSSTLVVVVEESKKNVADLKLD